METIADIMKMDREKQSQPINTAEVFAERSLLNSTQQRTTDAGVWHL